MHAVRNKQVQKTNSSLSSLSDRNSEAIIDQQSQGIPIQNGGHHDQYQSAKGINEETIEEERVDTNEVLPFREDELAKQDDKLKLRAKI